MLAKRRRILSLRRTRLLGTIACGTLALSGLASADTESADTTEASALVNEEAFREISQDAPISKQSEAEQASDAAASEAATGQGEAAQPEHRTFKFGPLSTWWDRGVRLKGKYFELKVGGNLLGDAVLISGDDAIDQRFETGWTGGVRHARVDITGTAGTRLYYRVQVDLTGQASTDLARSEYIKSAYLGVTGLGWFGRAELGILKEPVSMGVLTSTLNLDFMERGLPTVFAPSYNVGLLFRNEIFDDRVSWAFGVFRGQGEDGDQNAVDIAARLGTVVLRAEDDSHFLHVGGSYKYETGDFDVRFRARPETHWGDPWVDTGKISADRSHVFGLELAGLLKPISFQSEVLASWVDPQSGPSLAFWGFYVEASYFLTGEYRNYQTQQRVFGRVQLNHEFSWARKTWGALELALRYSYLDLNDRDVRGGQLRDITLGVNWYILSNLRLMANYIHAMRRDVGNGDLLSMRVQIDF